MWICGQVCGYMARYVDIWPGMRVPSQTDQQQHLSSISSINNSSIYKAASALPDNKYIKKNTKPNHGFLIYYNKYKLIQGDGSFKD